MNKLELIDLNIHYEKLDNGLEVYIVPKKSKGIFVTYNTKFGAKDIEFVPINEKKMYKFPLGIAHFLEHKMFEQEEGENVFAFYSKRGADSNANTSYDKTTYLFESTDFFEENLEFLLNYVQNPYFTDENVEKEKGIIEQEMNMINDNPGARLYYGGLESAFHEIPLNKPIVGTKDSIYSITKEDLYRCYNTFYYPSNMYLVLVGNVDVDKTISIIKENQSKRNLDCKDKVKLKEYKEKDSVKESSKTIKMNVTIPKVSLGYKINIEKIKMDRYKLLFILNSIFDIKLDKTSTLCEELRDKKIISDNLYLSSVLTKKHILFTIIAETEKYKELFDSVKNELKDLNITTKELERKKKVAISNIITVTDSIYTIEHQITNDIIRYGKVYNDKISIIKSITMDDVKEVIDNINMNNNFTYVIEKK